MGIEVAFNHYIYYILIVDEILTILEGELG